MNLNEAKEELIKLKELMLFDPLTGHIYTKECLNEENLRLYDAINIILKSLKDEKKSFQIENPYTGAIYNDLSEALNKDNYCDKHRWCNGCPLNNLDSTIYKSCTEIISLNSKEIASLLGYKIID